MKRPPRWIIEILARARAAKTSGLRILRIDSGLSIDQVAAEAHVPSASISRFETGIRQPKPRIAARILAVLLPDEPRENLPISWLWPDLDSYWSRNGRKKKPKGD